MSQKMELAELLVSVIQKEPKEIQFLPLNQVLIEGVRQNDKRPAWIKAAVPDGWVVNLMKNEKLTDGFILAKVSREFIEQHMKGKEESDESRKSGEEISSGSVCGEASEGSLPE